MAGITIPCYGICKGDPKWRDPVNGLGCCLCGCSGFVTTYNQRELAEKDWADFKAKQALKAEKADKKRRVA
jgi:hypothetical protein